MKTNLTNYLKPATFALALLTLSLTARADLEDKITKSFKAPPGDQLIVDIDRGNIEVKTADNDSVDIEVTRKAGGNQSKAEQVLKDHVVTMIQTNSRVQVRAEYKASSSLRRPSPELQAGYVIIVPRRFDVNLKTAGGHIKVVELTGKLNVSTPGGNLNLEKIEGPISGRTSGGHIALAGAKGKVDLKTSGGNLKLSEIEGDVTANTSGGHIKADKITGKTSLKTSGGNIDVVGIIGSVDADTSGGNITASLPVQPAGDCSFDTSGGNVTIRLTDKVAVDIDMHTDGGRVTTDLPVVSVIQGEQKNNTLRGKINGGGPLIKGHTSGGNIRIEKN